MNLYPRPGARAPVALTLLPVDAAYAYDYLSILYIKRDNGLEVAAEIERVEAFLALQHANMPTVLTSVAFKRLLVVNQWVFDAIEQAHRDAISAREVQRINLLRFKAKQRLQSEFWPGTALGEAKSALGRVKKKPPQSPTA